ncbi:MAG: DUF2087 domain-containing protein [Candidatus Wallbacteria bacterium]|nr:DUF2087 domain-containing protein [Candidatus Wallbacteria bacterium]
MQSIVMPTPVFITLKEYRARLLGTWRRDGLGRNRRNKTWVALHYFTSQLESDRRYSHADIRELFENQDYCYLRRQAVDFGFLDRTSDGRAYWRSNRYRRHVEFALECEDLAHRVWNAAPNSIGSTPERLPLHFAPDETAMAQGAPFLQRAHCCKAMRARYPELDEINAWMSACGYPLDDRLVIRHSIRNFLSVGIEFPPFLVGAVEHFFGGALVLSEHDRAEAAADLRKLWKDTRWGPTFVDPLRQAGAWARGIKDPFRKPTVVTPSSGMWTLTKGCGIELLDPVVRTAAHFDDLTWSATPRVQDFQVWIWQMLGDTISFPIRTFIISCLYAGLEIPERYRELAEWYFGGPLILTEADVEVARSYLAWKAIGRWSFQNEYPQTPARVLLPAAPERTLLLVG